MYVEYANLLLRMQLNIIYKKAFFFSSTTSHVKNVYLKPADTMRNRLFSTCLAKSNVVSIILINCNMWDAIIFDNFSRNRVNITNYGDSISRISDIKDKSYLSRNDMNITKIMSWTSTFIMFVASFYIEPKDWSDNFFLTNQRGGYANDM